MTELTSATGFDDFEGIVKESGAKGVYDSNGKYGVKVADVVKGMSKKLKDMMIQEADKLDLSDGKLDGVINAGGMSEKKADLLELMDKNSGAIIGMLNKVASNIAGNDGIMTREEVATVSAEMRKDPKAYMMKIAPSLGFSSKEVELALNSQEKADKTFNQKPVETVEIQQNIEQPKSLNGAAKTFNGIAKTFGDVSAMYGQINEKLDRLAKQFQEEHGHKNFHATHADNQDKVPAPAPSQGAPAKQAQL